MYERSAIVLEKYFNNICGFDKKINLKTIYKNYKEIVEEIKSYQAVLETEDEIINEFDEAANDIRKIQQEQKKIYKTNAKYEEERNQLFDSLDEDPSIIEKKLTKVEENIDKNNKRLEELREEFIEVLAKFNEKQQERNKYSRTRREEETKHLQIIDKSEKDLNQIELSEIKALKEFIKSEKDEEKDEVSELMINNGKDERVPFDKNVMESAAKIRNEIAKKEAECYIIIYERMRKLLSEINNDDIKLDKYKKALRDISVKLAFLKAEKMYIVSFLDNERMTAINGPKVHKQLMEDACEKFELDIEQINNLYELILKEVSGKSSKKAYNELYNKEYLKNIEEKERNFEKEVNNIKIKAGTIINSNYWRTEEIRNIYEVFQKEVSEKFEKDLSEFKLEEIEEEPETIENNIKPEEDDIFKEEKNDEIAEYIDEYEYEYDDDYEDEETEEDEDDNNDDEYEEEDNEDEYEYEYDDENEYEEDDDEYDEDEYEEDEYEEEEYEYEEDDDEYEDEDDDGDNEYQEDDSNDIADNKDKSKNHKEKNKKGIFNKFFKDKKD